MKQPRPRDAADKSIRLSARDFTLFIAAMNNPKSPGPRLKAAAEEYKTVRRAQPELNW